MELDAGERARLDDCDDALGGRRRARRLGRVGMREVERLAEAIDLGPPAPRDPTLAQPHRAAGDDPETAHAAVLLRLLESELEAEADAQHGQVVLDARAQDAVEPSAAQPLHRRTGAADAREHREV